jgi:CHAD domain-containing protein
MAFRIRRSEPVEEAIRRIAGDEVDAAIAEAAARGRSGEEAVHRVRKRCKRIRALVRLVRPQLAADYAIENAWYRDAARDLAHVRDAEAVIESFDALLQHFAEPLDRRAFAAIRKLLTRRRAATRDRTDLRNRLRDFRHRMREGRGRIESWRLEDRGFTALESGLTKTYTQGRKAMRSAYDAPSTDTIHEWRKRVKDHAHQVQLLRSVWKQPMGARRDEIDALADDLGNDHDLSLLRETLLACSDEVGKPETVQAVLGLVGRRQVELRIAAKAIGARVFAEKPDAFARRIEGYWDAWRNEPSMVAQLGCQPELVTA